MLRIARSSFLYTFILLTSFDLGLFKENSKRPFYNLAHMTNSVTSLDTALDEGANGIELDLQFNSEGKPLNVYHGFICDCFRKCDDLVNFKTYLQYIRNLTTPTHEKFNKNFTMVFIDLKTSDFDSALVGITAGKLLFDSLVTHLFNFGKVGTRVKIVLSLMTTYDESIIEGFMQSMKRRKLDVINNYIGWDISNGEALGFMFQKLLRTYNLNIWQSDGITNCLSIIVPRDRISSAVQIRDSKRSYMSKVCLWTVDLKHHMRQSLRIGVDALLTNYPAQLNAVLGEEEFSSKFRLATVNDNPWTKFND